MNKSQKIVLAIYLIIVFLMIAYPPYLFLYHDEIRGGGYFFIWQQPKMEYGMTTLFGVIDSSKLFVQLLGVSLIALTATYILKSKK